MENSLVKMDHIIIYYFNHFLDTLHLKMVKLVHGSWKECQKSTTPPSTTDKSFDPEIIYNYGKEK